jgi:TolB-like protein
MKNYGKCRLPLAALLFALPLLAGLCACTTRPAKGTPAASSQKDMSPSAASSQKDTPPSAAPVQKAVEPPQPPPPGIAVLVPESRGLNDAEAYLPTLVQGVLVGDFTTFSTMRVIDRQSLDKVIAEGESGVYTDESGFAQLGSVANVQYVMSGALQKTGSGFSLQIKVTEAVSGESKAAYTGTCTAAELENLTGVKKASADLLALMGVNLTDAQKTSLLGTTASIVQAETALSRGIVAQKSGTVVEALSYYFQAANYDPSLAEAASRLNVVSADIRSGNIGDNVRNDIQWRKDWTARLKECERFVVEYIKGNPPIEILYYTNLRQGDVNYNAETVSLSFLMDIPEGPDQWVKTLTDVVNTVNKGLENTGRRNVWGYSNWTHEAVPNRIEKSLSVQVELRNEKGAVIGRTTVFYNYAYRIIHAIIYTRGISFEDSPRFMDFEHSLVGREPFLGTRAAIFEGVKAGDITDKLSIVITSIDGLSPETASRNKNISIRAVGSGDLR